MYAYSRQKNDSEKHRELKRKHLKERQIKLQDLLNEESRNYEKEVKNMRINGANNSRTLDSLKSKIDGIKSLREEDRKRLAEEKMYQHWRENNPDIRQIESKRFYFKISILLKI